MTFKRTHSKDADLVQLIALLDQELGKIYPETKKEFEGKIFLSDDACCVIAYLDGKAAGCGCFKQYDSNSAEIKRVFVRNEFRRRGVSAGILEELTSWAIENGKRRLILETGNRQHQAIALYKKKGFVITEKFGDYKENPFSVCMEKSL